VLELVDAAETRMETIEPGSTVDVLVWTKLWGGVTVTTEAIEAGVDVTAEAGDEEAREEWETGGVPGLLEVELTGCVVVGSAGAEPAVPRGLPPRL